MIIRQTNVGTLLWSAFPNRPPEQITQTVFDFDDKHLRRLARLQPGERADAGDLYDYTQDLLYTEIETPWLAYLLPFCLAAWREDLHQATNEYGGVVEQLYPVLANRGVFAKHLTPEQTVAVSKFLQLTILEEMDHQRGLSYEGAGSRPYGWIAALATYGILLPDIEGLWREWWALGTSGRAIAAVQYLSCLMYPENQNPVFAPWTPLGGGGPPVLWEYAGHLYSHRWLQPNIDFLKTLLNVRQAGDVLARAVDGLEGQPEHAQAARVHSAFPNRMAIVEARCAELPRLLATIPEATTVREWSV